MGAGASAAGAIVDLRHVNSLEDVFAAGYNDKDVQDRIEDIIAAATVSGSGSDLEIQLLEMKRLIGTLSNTASDERRCLLRLLASRVASHNNPTSSRFDEFFIFTA